MQNLALSKTWYPLLHVIIYHFIRSKVCSLVESPKWFATKMVQPRFFCPLKWKPWWSRWRLLQSKQDWLETGTPTGDCQLDSVRFRKLQYVGRKPLLLMGFLVTVCGKDYPQLVSTARSLRKIVSWTNGTEQNCVSRPLGNSILRKHEETFMGIASSVDSMLHQRHE